MINWVKKLSIVYKLLLFVAIIITSITLIVSVVSLGAFNTSLTNAISGNLTNTAQLKINSIEQYYLSAIKSLNNFHMQPEVQGHTENIIRNDFSAADSREEMLKIATSFLTSYGYLNFEILDRDLNQQLSFHQVLEVDSKKKVIGKVVNDVIISDIVKHNNKFYTYLSKPIMRADSLLGYLSIKMDMAPIYAIIQDTTGLGRTGETLIAKRTNDNGALFLNPLRHKSGIALKLKVEKGNENAKPILNAVNRKEGIATSIDYRSKEVLAISRYVSLLDWGLVAKIDTEEAYVELHKIRRNIIIICVVVMLFFFVLVLFVSKLMIKQVNSIEGALNVLAKGNLLESDLNKVTNDEIGTMIDAVNLLRKNLSDSITFAQNIGEGKFEVDESIKNNEGELTTALVKMSSNLFNVAKEEEKRNWSVKGLALFGNILRENNHDIEVLCEKVLIELVKYIDANQGGIYVVEDDGDDKKSIKMKACYAWERLKMTDQKFEFGEGLIGQCVVEQESIYLSDVPNNFVSIKSGLGDANPNCVLIVPLKVNEDVIGVIEIASFKVYDEYQLDFVEKLAENIGSTISTAMVNERTKLLLDDSNMLTEQMRSQEEEMKQNMEELQATQEDADRRVHDLEEEIEKLKGNNSVEE